ncbi:MAG: cytochrome c3 family protein [Smithellaceae bacterium]|nr:cytochrome c3 family protein [Smithellaceae bacterium]
MKFKALIFTVVLAAILSALGAMAASIVGSKHDMSKPGGQPCVHCHTPHFAGAAIVAPLWNKKSTNFNFDAFTMYSSPTIDTTIPGRPSGISLACLGCHDSILAPEAATSTYTHGVINAPGSGLAGLPAPNSYWNNLSCLACHGTHGSALYKIPAIGPNLTNDHPISMAYPTAAQDAGFFIPPDLQKGWSDVPLYGGKVECASCHNVHDPARTPFLRVSNSGSALCYKCHNK